MATRDSFVLALSAHPKIGSQTLKRIFGAFEDPEEVWSKSPRGLQTKLGEKIAGLVMEAREKYDPEEETQKLQKLGIGFVTIYDKNYPGLLKENSDCPFVLFVRGNIEILKEASLAIVGSRKYSNYGKRFAYKMAKECAEAGLVIVSGLALGIDSIAQQAAIDCDGKTIGVLGCGLDKIYPTSNIALARAIIEKGGAIISEFPLGTAPFKQNFPARNRIIAGLSAGTFVVEAARSSGSLITAAFALEYNRNVYALPGPVDSEGSSGANLLIQQGAKLVMESGDILSDYSIFQKKARAKSIELETEEEKGVYEILKGGELCVDEIVRASNINVLVVNATLTLLEIKGMIENIGGGRYRCTV